MSYPMFKISKGAITPRDGVSKESVRKALNDLTLHHIDHREFQVGDKFPAYEISGEGLRSDIELLKELAPTFIGGIDIIGPDNRFSIFLQDGKAYERALIEILPVPSQTPEQAIGDYIRVSGMNPIAVLEGMSDFLAAEVWRTEDIMEELEEEGISGEEAKKLLPVVLKYLDKSILKQRSDEKYFAVQFAIKDAVEEVA